MLQFYLRAASGNADPRIPEGGVLLWDNVSPPAGGWEVFTAADTRALMGAATAGEVGAIGGPIGSAPGRIELTAALNSAGAHNGTSFNGHGGTPPAGAKLLYVGGASAGAHTHTWSLARNHNPALVSHPLIRKTGGPGPIPLGAGVFAPGALPSGALDEIATYIGKVLRGNNTLATLAAVSGLGAIAQNSSSDGAHGHGSVVFGSEDITFEPRTYDAGPAGTHAHSITGTVSTVNVPVGRVAHHRANVETVVPVGTIIPFNGVESNIKDGWRLCDGGGGSMDLRGRFLEIAASGAAGVVAGDGTIVWSGTVNSAGDHDHIGADRGFNLAHTTSHSNVTGAHVHTLSGQTGVIDLRRYLIRFIQFLP